MCADLPEGSRRIHADGLLVCPSLWEIHIHGCGAVSVEHLTPDGLTRMGEFLATKRVGGFVLTTVADEGILSRAGSAIDAVSTAVPGVHGRVPGIHVEGPFVARVRKGGIPEDLIRAPSIQYLRSLKEIARSHIKVMTFAPELPGASELFNAFSAAGILPSLGHSDALLEDLKAYENVTPLAVTHLFNGMSGVSHKDPGLAQWAILNNTVYTELNCDGTHAHDAAV